jgi:cation diffusion facilitator family transporter
MNDERSSTIKRVTYVGIIVNILLSLAQIISGLLAHSQALIADGLHTLADLISDFVVIFAAHHAARDADADHPYGHARIETLTSIFLGIALITVAIGIGYRGILSVAEPSPQQTEPYAIAFAFLAIFSKEFLYRYTIRAARKIRSTLLESNALHHRSDVFSSIIVVIGVSAQILGVEHMDALAAIVISIMISFMGIHLVKKAFTELIDTSLDQELVENIKDYVVNMDGVLAVHRLRSRSMGGMGYIDIEIRVSPDISVSEAHFISLHIENTIKKEFQDINDVTIHIDPLADTDHDNIVNLPNRAELLFSLYSSWEDIDGADKLCNIRLHYLTKEVDVDVVLPLDSASKYGAELAGQLVERAKNLSYIGKVSIYYARI